MSAHPSLLSHECSTTVYVLAYTGLLVAPIIARSSPDMEVHTYRYAGMIPRGVK